MPFAVGWVPRQVVGRDRVYSLAMATAGLSVSSSSAPSPRRLTTGRLGAVLFLLIALPCYVTLPWSLSRYDVQRSDDLDKLLAPPNWSEPMGTDDLGRSLMWRCLLGGAISLGIGMAAAGIAVGIGVTWGAMSGYAGGRIDSAMMRAVDVFYGLPYILLVVMISLALQPTLLRFTRGVLGLDEVPAANTAGVVTLLIAIGGVSWLTMSRVIRGQVLSLREQPFIEATRAIGMGPVRVFARHLLPNLMGVIIVYSTLAVPVAILQESFLSFLGIGVRPPLPSWGNLASRGVQELGALAEPDATMYWWLLVFPCLLLGLTLLALNFLGDALRERFDPKRQER